MKGHVFWNFAPMLTPWPRRIGYGMMASALAIALLERRGLVASIGPLPVIVAVLMFGMIGAMLVFTDLMVRSIYAQIDAARQRQQGLDPEQSQSPEQKGPADRAAGPD